MRAADLVERDFTPTVPNRLWVTTSRNGCKGAAEMQAALRVEHLGALSGLGPILPTRALGEFGDDQNRLSAAESPKNYAARSPISRASRKHRVVLARYARNRPLAGVTYLWAFSALSASPRRPQVLRPTPRHRRHPQPSPTLANRLLGILDRCLTHRTLPESLGQPHRWRCGS